jgi:hypothetical protein
MAVGECANGKFVGRVAVLRYQILCPDEKPVVADWKRVGAMTTKDLSLEWDLTEADGDDNEGAVAEQLASQLNMTVSGDGLCMKTDNSASNQIELTLHVHNPEATGGQPYAWIQLVYPDLTFEFPALVNSMSRSGENRSSVTFSFEATAVQRGRAYPTPAPVVP